jgi:hypothetical protein
MSAGKILRRAWLALLMLITACGQHQAGAAVGRNNMHASTTYLYLLKSTPFFTRLTGPQLRWVIANSHEWEAAPGTVIVDCAESSDAIWILLDGGWQIDHDGKHFPAGHADPGKWFSALQGHGACKLVTNEHSYVMKIERSAMDSMLAQGFEFGAHLESGHAYYRTLFAGKAAQK